MAWNLLSEIFPAGKRLTYLHYITRQHKPFYGRKYITIVTLTSFFARKSYATLSNFTFMSLRSCFWINWYWLILESRHSTGVHNIQFIFYLPSTRRRALDVRARAIPVPSTFPDLLAQDVRARAIPVPSTFNLTQDVRARAIPVPSTFNLTWPNLGGRRQRNLTSPDLTSLRM